MKKFFKKHKALVIVLVVVGLICWGIGSLIHKAKVMGEEMLASMQSETVTVERRNLVSAVPATGKISSVNTGTVIAEVSGVDVVSVLFAEGDYVNAGDLVCVLSTEDLEKNLAQAEASTENSVASANISVNSASRNLKSAQTQSAVTAERYEQQLKETEPESKEPEEEPQKPESEPKIKEEAPKAEKDYNDSSSRSMNDDELALFGQFAQTKTARQNLLRSLDKISLAAYTGNVFVTGETTEESVDLAKNVIRYVKNTDANFTGKIAKVSGEALNNKMVSVMVEKLANGGLIIEKASGMSAETTKNLLRALNQENMHKMMEYFDGMKQIINVHIEVEELSDDALVAYGKKYAEHLEYSIDDMGILALHTRIDELQTSDHVVTVADVRSIIDEAIEKANKKTLKHFTDVLFAKRYDEEDMIILRENDFLS